LGDGPPSIARTSSLALKQPAEEGFPNCFALAIH